jgi:hypothetical protein
MNITRIIGRLNINKSKEIVKLLNILITIEE